MVRHPIQTAQGLAGAIAHPVQTAKAVANSVADTWSSGNRGQGQIVGNALIMAATVAAPYAKAGGAAKSPTAFRYVSEAEATISRQSGFVPNVTQAGTPKYVFYSPERFTSASAAEDALRIGSKNPFGPTATPTHRITVDASKANWTYGGSVEGAPGIEFITTERLPVLRVDPLKR
jgi:hypothetical protein